MCLTTVADAQSTCSDFDCSNMADGLIAAHRIHVNKASINHHHYTEKLGPT